VHEVGRRGSAAFAAVKRAASRFAGTPWPGVVVVTPLVLLLGAGASAPSQMNAMVDNGIQPLAAVSTTDSRNSGTEIVRAKRPLPYLRIVAATVAAPPPSVVVNSPGNMRIPSIALAAYQNAERMMAAAAPGCGISWNLLAGIGRIESQHAFGGATDARGTAVNPIYGPTLDGTLAGNEVIVQSVQSGRVTYARAMGPMQFLPGTWARYAADGDGDGKADVQNVFDASLAAARYLCSGGLNLRDPSQVMTAILRYNNSTAYASNVLGWAGAYATGVEPVDLPPITGSHPIGDAHLDTDAEGLGPGMPLNAVGLPADDPMALMPLTGPGRPDLMGQLTPQPGQGMGRLPGPPASSAQDCRVFCLQGSAPAPAPAANPMLPPWLAPPPPAAPELPPAGPPPGEPGPPPPAVAPIPPA
jgi:membrane-bound lytic murein transglycosylase B